MSELGMLIGSDLKQRLYQAGLEAAGQRRTVTVLFADLCDYTGLSGKIDDEILYEVIHRFLRMLAEKVYQFGGMVDKITGDGLMALFGAPIALENPAERAVRAAMEMKVGLEQLNRELEENLGEKLKMNCGLNRGSVIVGGIGSDLLIDYTAIGDSVNLARRLQESAAPDTILVSESVFQATQAWFEYREIAELELKGYQQKLKGYCLLGLKSQPGLVRGIRGLHSPMVGREADLEMISDALIDLTQARRGQVVTIIGEAGIGKSRLTAEFKTLIDPERATLLEGQSLTYRKSVSYWIFQEVLRSYLGVSSAASKVDLHERLVAKVNQILGSEARSVLPFLEKLLSLEYSDPVSTQRLAYLDAEQLRQQTFIAVRKLLLTEAEQQPLILILEDLHWADEISLELLAFLIDSIDDKPVLVLAITRQEMDSRFEDLLNHTQVRFEDRCRIIRLQNLSDEQSDELLFGLLGMPDVPSHFRAQVLNRAAGIPFYIEEIIRMLIDEQILVNDGGEWLLTSDEDLALQVPDNLQDLILTRFDHLNPVQRNVLQTASVIGREFNAGILNEIVRLEGDNQIYHVLATLEEKAFVLPVPEQGNDAYLFRHVLTSDAVYRTLLRRDRNRLHGIVAQTLERVYQDQLDSQVEVLAGHYLRSLYLDKALHYLILAGKKSAREYANVQAKKYYEEARDLLSEVTHSAEQAMQVGVGLGDVLVFIGEYDHARACYQEVLINHSIEASEVIDKNVIHRKVAVTYERQGDFDQALDHLTLASEILNAEGDSSPVAGAQILNDTGWIYFLRGNFDRARNDLHLALDLVEGTDEYSTIASILNRLGAVSYQLRDYKLAATFVRKSLDLRKTLGDLSGEARLYNNLGLLGLMSGDLHDAETNFNQSLTLLDKVGDTEGIALANINLGLVKYELGAYKLAQVYLEKAKGVAEKIGHRFYLGLAYMYLGRLETALGEYEQSVNLLVESLNIFRELGANDNLIDSMCYLAECYLAWEDLENSIHWSEQAWKALTSDGADLASDSVQAGRVLRLQGSIARQEGNLELASENLLDSAEIFSAAMERLESARTAYELGLLAYDLNDPERANIYFSQAREIFTEVGAEKELQRVEVDLRKIRV